MFNKSKIYGRVIGLGFFLALTPDIALAQKDIEVAMPATAREQTSLYPSFQNKVLGLSKTSQFQKIDRPMGLKLAVAFGGLGLIGAELWWFVFSKTNIF